MIIKLEAESHEMFPPLMLDQAKKAIVQIIEGYGWKANIKVNIENKLDAEQRWWAWLRQEQEKGG